MSKVALQWLAGQQIASGTLKGLLQVIAFEAKKDTGDCCASQAELADRTGMTDRTVRRSLLVLEQLEIIKRTPRSKGRYGRTTDTISLALGRNFDISKAAIQALRKAAGPALQPDTRSGSAKISKRTKSPLQPDNLSREYNIEDTEIPYQGRDISKVEGCSTTSGKPSPHDEADAHRNVIQFPRRGAA